MPNLPDDSRPAPSPELITVLCVDDSPKLVRALCAMIDGELDMRSVGGLYDADEFLRRAPEIQPRVALVDLTMPGKISTVEAIRAVSRSAPDIRVVVYSGYDDPDTVDSVMEAGAWGLVSKLAKPAAVIQAVRRVAAGEVVS